MIKVTFNDAVFNCARAVKGVNYIRLYDEANIKIVAFEEVTDFSGFLIEGGEWELGKSTQRVAAFATKTGNSFALQLKEKVIVEDGLSVSFDAPVGSTGITAVVINSRSYSLVNTVGAPIDNASDAFCAGAKLEIILSISGNQYKAYLQNGAVSTVPITKGGTGASTKELARRNLCVPEAIESEDYLGCFYCTGPDGSLEWINPPMMPEVEYRTTERYMDMPVFVQLFNLDSIGKDNYATANVGGASRMTITEVNTNGYCVEVRVANFDKDGGNSLQLINWTGYAIDNVIVKIKYIYSA